MFTKETIELILTPGHPSSYEERKAFAWATQLFLTACRMQSCYNNLIFLTTVDQARSFPLEQWRNITSCKRIQAMLLMTQKMLVRQYGLVTTLSFGNSCIDCFIR